MHRISKCFSLLLSLLLAGSGMLHAVLHSAGCCVSNEHDGSVQVSRIAHSHGSFRRPDILKNASVFQNVFCPVCAGFLTGLCADGKITDPVSILGTDVISSDSRTLCIWERRLLPEVRAPPAV